MATERQLRDRLDRATAAPRPAVAVVDLAAFDANAAALAGRAGGKPVRVASKSVRCRELLEPGAGRPGWRGVMAFTLARGDLAGPRRRHRRRRWSRTRPRTGPALAELAADPALAAAVTLMVDDPAQLDLDRRGRRARPPADAAGLPRPGRLLAAAAAAGCTSASAARRCTAPGRPARSPPRVAGRPGFRLVGLMSYEAQIAGLGDAPPGQAAARRGDPADAARVVPRAAGPPRRRRSAAVREHADLEFVNGGGTGSVAATSADPAVTEVTAGLRPVRADAVRRLPRLAADPGGVLRAAGGPPAGAGHRHGARRRLDRLRPGRAAAGCPSPWLPAGLKLLGTEGAGEVQTPLTGAAAAALRVGDRVWFRHAKAGELCEHVNELHLVDGDRWSARCPPTGARAGVPLTRSRPSRRRAGQPAGRRESTWRCRYSRISAFASASTRSSPSGSRRNASLISASAGLDRDLQARTAAAAVGQAEPLGQHAGRAGRRSRRCCPAARRAGAGPPRRRSAGYGSRAPCGAW